MLCVFFCTVHHFPWRGLLLNGIPAFLVGVAIGRLSETHKETVMALRVRSRAIFDRLAPILFVLIALAALSGIWLGAAASIQNGRNLVTNCENANESRAAARSLWNYILDVSMASNPDPTKREQRFYDDFRGYVNAVYVQHDCSDLGKKYPLPDPPKVPAGKGHKG